MKTWIKWTLATVGGLAVVLVAAALIGIQLGERKRNRVIDIKVQPFAIPSDAAAVERGRYLYASRGCASCHGANGAGRAFIDSPDMRVVAPNISPGPGNAVAGYRSEDWARTLRHGVKPDGRPLFIMPSEDYNQWTDDDAGALVAYVKGLPPASGGAAQVKLSTLIKVVYGFGLIPDPVERIDHRVPPPAPVPVAVSVEHGRYVAAMCIGCHGAGLSGGKVPGGPPNWPAAANLTPGDKSVLGNYRDAAQLATMFKSGKRPDGSAIEVMPFDALREMNEIDVQALYAYLKTLPARPFGQR